MSRGAAKIRYINAQSEALTGAVDYLRPYLPVAPLVREMSGKTDDAWSTQCYAGMRRSPPSGGWNWIELRKHYARDPQSLRLAIWAPDDATLCGLMVARLNATACVIERVEGAPDDSHPLKGYVLPIALEVGARYAQRCGRRELWLCEPSSQELIDYYVGLGFEYVSKKVDRPFCRREV